MEFKEYSYVIVGAGFFGSVLAERIAADLKEKVAIIDKRSHLGGNSFSYGDPQTGIEIHKYGSHIFHTSNEKVWEYINSFCAFNNYRHKVITQYQDKKFPLPINLETINNFYGLDLDPAAAKAFIEKQIAKEKIKQVTNLEEKAIKSIGRRLYDAFIKGYTRKQWGADPKLLPISVINRLPIRFNYLGGYFRDNWQGIPIGGYGRIFSRMISNKLITVLKNTKFRDIAGQLSKKCKIIYSGPIDEYFNYKYGKLNWRSLKFETDTKNTNDYQGTAVINYPEIKYKFTRIHEFKHYDWEFTETTNRTVIAREYSKSPERDDEFYYPVQTQRDKLLLSQYIKESKKHTNIIFGGRLGSYQYLDMDQTIASALAVYESIKKRRNYGDIS